MEEDTLLRVSLALLRAQVAAYLTFLFIYFVRLSIDFIYLFLRYGMSMDK